MSPYGIYSICVCAFVCVDTYLQPKFYRQFTNYMKRVDLNGSTTNESVNWGALNHVSHAPRLMSCTYYECVCACIALTRCSVLLF